MRHEAAVRNIHQLKNEIDALRAELRDKKLEATDLESEETAIKQQMDEKTIELENFRNDYKSCIGIYCFIQLILKNLVLRKKLWTMLQAN